MSSSLLLLLSFLIGNAKGACTIYRSFQNVNFLLRSFFFLVLFLTQYLWTWHVATAHIAYKMFCHSFESSQIWRSFIKRWQIIIRSSFWCNFEFTFNGFDLQIPQKPIATPKQIAQEIHKRGSCMFTLIDFLSSLCLWQI